MIQVEHLTKYYGDFLALDDVSFEIGEGHVYGFLGPNGAGKSTTMNIMTGCLSATEGHVRIDGFDIFEQPKEAKKRIGYLPEQPPLYLGESPQEYLKFVGEAKGIKGAKLKEQVESVIQQTGIQEVRNRRIKDLSKGYKQRVGIAQALLGDPEVIILDEPTVGLDPIQIIEIRDLIRELGQTHTVIFSSHILSEVQTICDQILMISKGRLVACDTPENLESQFLAPNEISLLAEATPQEVQTILSGVTGLTEAEPQAREDGCTAAVLRFRSGDVRDVARSVFFAFAKADRALLEMSVKKASLEDVFLELTEQSDAEDAAAAPAPEPLPGPGEAAAEEEVQK